MKMEKMIKLDYLLLSQPVSGLSSVLVREQKLN